MPSPAVRAPRIGSRASRWLPLVGAALFLFIVSRLDLARLGRELTSVRPDLVAAAVVLYALLLLLRAWRWRALLLVQGIRAPIRWLLGWVAIGGFLGSLTPARVGDLVRIRALGDLGHPLAPACASVLVDRMLDLALLALAGFMAMASRLLVTTGSTLALFILAIAGVVLSGWALLVRGQLTWLVKRSAGRILPAEVAARLAGSLGDLGGTLSRYNIRTLASPVALTTLNWCCYVGLNVCLAGAVGIGVPVVDLVVGLVLVAVLGFLPATVGGVGTREATLIVLFGHLGVSSETVVAYGLLEVVMIYGVGGAMALAALTVLVRKGAMAQTGATRGLGAAVSRHRSPQGREHVASATDRLELLACPRCQGVLEPATPLRCRECGAVYAVTENIPRLLPAEFSIPFGAYFEGRAARDSLAAMDYRGPWAFHLRQKWLRATLPPRGDGPIVDVACGNGRMTAPWAQGGTVLGVDASLSMLNSAARRGLLAVEGSAERLPLRNGIAAAVVALEVAQYLDSPVTLAQQMARVARTGATLCLSWLPPSLPRRARRRLLGLHPGSPRLHPVERVTAALDAAGWEEVRLTAGFWPARLVTVDRQGADDFRWAIVAFASGRRRRS